jgi:hypothetical protein
VPLDSVLAQQGDFESGEVMAEVILVGAVTVSGWALWGGFKKEPRGVKALMKVYNRSELRSRDCTLLTSSSRRSSAGFRKVLYVEPREVYLP